MMSLFKSVFPRTQSEQGLVSAIMALEAYERRSIAMVNRSLSLFKDMTEDQKKQAAVVGYLERIHKIVDRIQQNSRLVEDIAQFARSSHSIGQQGGYEDPSYRVVELLEHYARDWSEEYAEHRNKLFEPVLKLLGPLASQGRGMRVLIPGAGLARFAYEVERLGMTAVAVEYSWLMHLGNQFLKKRGQNPYHIYPFVHEQSHHRSEIGQLRPVLIPDDPQLLSDHQPILVQGDFTKMTPEEYGQFDALVTIFFIDTAENLFDYLDAIYRMLKPGGLWINYGPLKWGTAPKVALTMEELQSIMENSGKWKIEQRFEDKHSYNGDPQALWNAYYIAQGWSAIRQ